MYMTTPEIRLLKFLKKIQVDLGSYIAIDQCFKYVTRTETINSERAQYNFNNGIYFKLPYNSSLSQHVFDELVKKDYVKCCTSIGTVFQVTYAGWYSRSIHRAEIRDLILKNIVLPIFVSVITTLITLWISAKFQQ